ncbi:MAG: zinc-binding dehydrogenase [Deltaproteobacteria bacterium]|jgi:alcohol dehydrogenase|nr:zinc-binding dehydrogenase [Deltaproteobacteria bacterium]
MRAVVFHRHGGTEELSVEEFPEPEARAGDAILEVGATSINGFDPMIVAGSTGLKTPLPMVPCGDIAGRIVSFGPETDPGPWKIGDRVCPHPFVVGEGMTGETRLGAACERVRIPVATLLPIPDGVSDAQAASLPIAYGTAHRLMQTRGRIQAGEKVLVLGATGGVGVACLQLGKRVGAELIVAGSAEWKLERLLALGADHAIDTSKEEVVAAVHERFGKPHMLGGGGVDVVVNFIGGESWVAGLRCLGSHGRMITCGATAGYQPPTDIRFIWTYEQTILGSNGWLPADQSAVLEMVASGELAPEIHAVRPLGETAASIQELADRKVVGKFVITP